jgi:hypothetical protein
VVQPLDEFRLKNPKVRLIGQALHHRRFCADMGHTQKLVAAIFLQIREIVPQCPFNVAGQGLVSLDQV